MLTRVLEPEVMDAEEEARDYDYMDHDEVNRSFAADWLQLRPDVSNVLDLGTGTALIPIEICRQVPEAHLTGVELGEWMLKYAGKNVEQADLAARIQLEHADAKQLSHADGHFSSVISNSIVHHVAEPIVVLREALRVLRPGGVIFVRDLLRPAEREELTHLVNTYAGDANSHQQELFGDSLRAALTLEELTATGGELGFGKETVEQTTDRHWTWKTTKESA
ncbi:MAG: class I SAM-dependent methyltransferase [Planctomycetales bacterium]